jgi:hypothetical protein
MAPSLQCGREITGSGFVISRDPVGTGLDYEELGAFCNQDCGDKRVRSYLYKGPDEQTFQPTATFYSGDIS